MIDNLNQKKYMWKAKHVWNILTICLFIFIAMTVKDKRLAVGILFVAIASTVHHMNLHMNPGFNVNLITFVLDCIAQLFLLFIFINVCDAALFKSKIVPQFLSWTYIIIGAGLLLYCAEIKVYSWRTTAICAWVLMIVYAITISVVSHNFQTLTWILIILSILCFILGNLFPKIYFVSWPLLHAIGFLLIFCILLDLKLMHPFSLSLEQLPKY